VLANCVKDCDRANIARLIFVEPHQCDDLPSTQDNASKIYESRPAV
jgi:hypothetical protein